MKKAQEFFRANPQAFLLFLICVVLGIGSFLAIVIALASSGGHTTGQPEGLLKAVHTAAGIARAAVVA